MKIACKACGKEVESHTHNKKYCSAVCLKSHKYKLSKLKKEFEWLK